jgi:hypothetical protein
MSLLILALLIAALVLFLLGIKNIAAPRYSLVSAGLAAWVLAEILGRWAG